MTQISWCLVVPVKPLVVAKSRLQVLGDAMRQELALAFAADVVRAALGCTAIDRVLVVTDDSRVSRVLSGLGADVIADEPAAGHNAALQHAVATLGRTTATAALSADLPSVISADLQQALTQVALLGRGFVADADGSGTTLLASMPGEALRPAYGPHSRADHEQSGAVALPAHPRLRRDVDTPQDLAVALGLGVGPATMAALSSAG